MTPLRNGSDPFLGPGLQQPCSSLDGGLGPDTCLPDWPYPRWIAHRGAGKLAPENTLAAFRLGAAHGYRMFECDAQLSADGVVFLMHDATLERTTNGQGIGSDLPWLALSQLDAGSWHSSPFAGETLPTLEALARFCQTNGHLLNIEIKPTPGTESATGEAVARLAAQLRQGAAVPPLLTSFKTAALAAAQATAPELPRGLLLDTLWTGWFEKAQELGCLAVVAHYPLWDAATVARVHSAGMRCLSYTVNDDRVAQHLLALGTDGIITDRVDLFSPH
jgi:glycerophosphoryl diester phosphodiesterase